MENLEQEVLIPRRNRSTRRKPNLKRIFAAIAIVIIVLLTTVGSMALAIANQETVAKGIKVDNVSLEGLTRQEAYTKIKDIAAEKMADNAIHLVYNDLRWDIPAEKIGLVIDVDTALEEAYTPGHTGGTIQRFTEKLTCMLEGKQITLTADYNGELLEAELQQVAAQVRQEPSSATCYFGPELSILRSPAVLGQSLNVEELTVTLNRKLLDLDMPDEIPLELDMVQPPITDADLANMDTILASYSTTFGAGANRSQNIFIAAQAINGSFVRPNGVFSFNDTVGYRSAANGYKSAPVIVAGKMEMDYGGGVCQVSSTLYNAILLAGLTSTERTRHFFPSTYVPAGMDATVADGVLDFKFRNPYPHGIYLLTSCYSGTLTVYVIGCGADLQGREYKLVRDVHKGGIAPVVTLYRVVYQNGSEIAREDLHTDHYDEPEPDPEPSRN